MPGTPRALATRAYGHIHLIPTGYLFYPTLAYTIITHFRSLPNVIFRIFGGIGLLLLGLSAFIGLPAPLPVIMNVCILVGGIGLLAGI